MAIKKYELMPSSSPEELKKVLQSLASDWGDVIEDLDLLQITPLTGALTNEVYQINWPQKNNCLHRKLLVRIYGQGVEIFFNRDDEITRFECISKHGQGPKLLGRFSDGRIEEFIHARTLSAEDLHDPEISAIIAAKLREFHSLDMPGPKTVMLWDKIRYWLSKARSLCSAKDAEEFQLDIIEDEISLLEQELPQQHQEIGFCHNDLQYGNIMMDRETRSITIIDYEYAGYNPVCYDIANHFCEMAANYHSDTPHLLDYTLYPGVEQRRRFVQIYLSSAGSVPNESEVDQLVEDAEKYSLASHLYAGLWGIISGHVNKIDFDYMEYARQRFQQYWLKKPTLLT